MQDVLERRNRRLTRCLVCGFAEVRSDEVASGVTLFLAECPRCEHRWTSPVPFGEVSAAARPAAVRVSSRGAAEVASAA